MNIQEEIAKFTGKLSDTVSEKAKSSAIATLKDPEFKKTVNVFVRDFYEENKYIIIPVVGSFVLLSVLAIVNIVTSFSRR